MTTQDIFKCVKGLLGLCLMMFAMASCTYDYFVDENNLRLYVPQIKEGTISNFYVAFHDKNSGAHTLTRRVEAPFDKDDLMKSGVLRFKLPFGDYRVTCFANAALDGLPSGQHFDESYGVQKLRQQEDIYDAYATDPRVLLTEATVYPIGHPNAADMVEVDINDDHRIKARVSIKCIGLPASAKRIDTYYTGLSTRYNFDGLLSRFTDQDRLFSGSYPVAPASDGSVTLGVNTVMPSANQTYGIVPPLSLMSRSTEQPAYMEFQGDIYDEDNHLLGRLIFKKGDYSSLPDAEKPKKPDGSLFDYLYLTPKMELTLTFKDLYFTSAEVNGWGDIIGGGGEDEVIP